MQSDKKSHKITRKRRTLTYIRILSALDTSYKVVTVQPVDMFPHTPHVENVVLLERK